MFFLHIIFYIYIKFFKSVYVTLTCISLWTVERNIEERMWNLMDLRIKNNDKENKEQIVDLIDYNIYDETLITE